jgi:hypothetical protein
MIAKEARRFGLRVRAYSGPRAYRPIAPHPSLAQAFAWAAWSPDETRVLASGRVDFQNNTHENKYLVRFQLDVLLV